MKSFTLKITAILFVIQLLVLILLRFRGNYHSFYINAYSYFLDKGNFKFDLFLNNSLLFDSTIYYKLLSFLGIKIETDFVLFCIHLVLIFVNLYFYFHLIRKFYNPKNKWTISIYIIPALVLANFLAPNAESALIYSHTGTGTQIAFTSILLMVFFTLQQKWMLAFLLGCFSLLLASKHAAFPFFVSITYFLITQFGYKSVTKVYVICSLIFFSTIYLYFSWVPNEYITENIQIIDFIILRDQHEDALYLQSARGIFKLFIGFSCLLISARYIKDLKHKSYLLTVFYLSLIAVLFGGLYTSTLYLYYPVPYFVLLSTIKAMFLMQFFACAGITKIIIESSLNSFSKALFICVLFFGSFGGQTGENLAFLLLLIGGLIQFLPGISSINRFLPNSFFYNVKNRKLQIPEEVQILLMVLVITIPLTTNTLNNKLNSYSPYHEGRFSIVNTNKKFLQEVSKLKDCNDFNILPIEKDYFLKYIESDQLQNITNPFLIYFSKKSNYLGDPAHLYLDIQNQKIYLERKKNIMNLFNRNASKSDRKKAWTYVKQDQVIIIAPNGLLPDYFSEKVNLNSDDFIYIFPSGVKQRETFIRECQPFFMS